MSADPIDFTCNASCRRGPCGCGAYVGKSLRDGARVRFPLFFMDGSPESAGPGRLTLTDEQLRDRAEARRDAAYEAYVRGLNTGYLPEAEGIETPTPTRSTDGEALKANREAARASYVDHLRNAWRR